MKELTKQAIADALAKRLKHQPIGQITVKELCLDCGINRQTFYYHFQDIYDLCFWITERRLKAHIEAEQIDQTDTRRYLNALFECFTRYRQQAKNAFDALSRGQYETLLNKRALPIILKRLHSYEEAAQVSQENLDFIASFYALTLGEIWIKWIEEGLPEKSRAYLDKFCTLMDGSMKTLLLKFAGEAPAL